MKIAAPKLAPASRDADRSQPKRGNTGIVPPGQAAKGGNTGIVPPAQTGKGGNTGIVPPAQGNATDGFQPAIPRGKSGTPSTGSAATSGSSAATLSESGSTSTYFLPPNLEPHRKVFDFEGERIANLSIELQQAELKNTSLRLAEQFKDIASPEEVDKALNESYQYYLGRRTTTEPPQAYAMAEASVDVSTNGRAPEASVDFGVSITPEPPPSLPESSASTQDPTTGRNAGNSLRNRRQQEEQQLEEISQLFLRMRRFFF